MVKKFFNRSAKTKEKKKKNEMSNEMKNIEFEISMTLEITNKCFARIWKEEKKKKTLSQEIPGRRALRPAE